MKVYHAIAAVSGELSKVGISKDRYNEQQRFNFRGIDDFFNALSMPLAKNKLIIFPRYYDREVIERTSKSGSAVYYVSLKCDFTFVCADDGSVHTATIVSEAMDMADKATNKAMSAAYKYMAAQVFCIPVEGLDDSDADQGGTETIAGTAKIPANAKLSAEQVEQIEALLLTLHDNDAEAVMNAGRAIINHLTNATDGTWSDVDASRYGSIVSSINKKLIAKANAKEQEGK